MTNSRLHILAILLAVLTFLLIGSGALLTSDVRPLPGTAPAAAQTAPIGGVVQMDETHRILAGVVAVVMIGLAIVSSPTARIAAWIGTGLVAIEGLLGFQSGGGGMLTPTAGALHAILAPILFAAVVSVVLFTSRNWSDPAIPAKDIWPPLNKLALLVPMFVILQIALGAAFRHNEIGVFWHILNAMVTLMLILILGICVVRQYPDHPVLRPAATAMLAITGVQVLLGFAAFMVLLVVSANNMGLIVVSVIHVLTGSLTLAAAVVLSLQLRRSALAAASLTGH